MQKAGIWIIKLSELKTLTRREAGTIKAFVG